MYLVDEKDDCYDVWELCCASKEDYEKGNHDTTGLKVKIDKDIIDNEYDLIQAIRKAFNVYYLIDIVYEY